MLAAIALVVSLIINCGLCFWVISLETKERDRRHYATRVDRENQNLRAGISAVAEMIEDGEKFDAAEALRRLSIRNPSIDNATRY